MSVSSVQENPRGAADLQQVRRSRIGQTLKRRPAAPPSPGAAAGRSAGGGLRRRRLPQRSRDGELRRGTSRGQGTNVGRRTCQGTRASSDPASRCLSPPVPQSWGSGNPAAMDREAAQPRQRGRVTARWPQRPRISARTPWTAAALVAAKRAGRNPSRRWETSRTERAGEATPGMSGPDRRCRRRGGESQEGKASAVMPGPGPLRGALRGAQACGSRFGRRSEAGRAMEHLVADHHGAEGAANQRRRYVARRTLREAGQP